MGKSQSRPSTSTPLGCLLWNLKALGFQGEIRPERLIYYSNTVCPRYRLDNRSQWPENGTPRYNTLGDPDNFCHCNGKWLEIPSVQIFFALPSRPSLCESYSTSQVLLTHSGPHPPKTMSPDPCSGFSSSSDPSDHSPPPAAPDPVPDPPAQVRPPPPPQAGLQAPAPHASPQAVPEVSSEPSAPPALPGSPA